MQGSLRPCPALVMFLFPTKKCGGQKADSKNLVDVPMQWFCTICTQVCPKEGGLNLNSLPGEDMSAISRQKRLLIASKEWKPCQHIERAKQKNQKQGNRKVRNKKNARKEWKPWQHIEQAKSPKTISKKFSSPTDQQMWFTNRKTGKQKNNQSSGIISYEAIF